MNLVMWVLVAVLAGLVAGFVMKRGCGRGWDIGIGLVGSVAVGWLFQSQWVASAPSLMAVTLVAAAGAAGLIVAQRNDLSRPRACSPVHARRHPTNVVIVEEEPTTWKRRETT